MDCFLSNDNINIIGGYINTGNTVNQTYSLMLFDMSGHTNMTFYIQENFDEIKIKPQIIHNVSLSSSSCENSFNSNYNFSISNCSLSLVSNNSIDNFNLINLSYTNNTQHLVIVEPSYKDSFIVLPTKLRSNFTFLQCPNQECIQFNQEDYFNIDQFFFKLQGRYIYDWQIYSTVMLVRSSEGKINYFREVQDLLFLRNGVYSLKMNKFPKEFDLVLNLKTNSTEAEAEVMFFNI